MRTLLGATQSSFADSKVVVTAGVRWDRITFDQYAESRLAASHPDVVAGRKIANTAAIMRNVHNTAPRMLPI